MQPLFFSLVLKGKSCFFPQNGEPRKKNEGREQSFSLSSCFSPRNGKPGKLNSQKLFKKTTLRDIFESFVDFQIYREKRNQKSNLSRQIYSRCGEYVIFPFFLSSAGKKGFFDSPKAIKDTASFLFLRFGVKKNRCPVFLSHRGILSL